MQWPLEGPTLSGPRNAEALDVDVSAVIAETARAHATQPAIVHGADVLSYAELMDRVDELRSRLADLGVRPGSALAVQLPRGPGHVVAVLAALAHGCPFVPVAEAEPADRVARIVRQVGIVARLAPDDAGGTAVSAVGSLATAPTHDPRLAYIMHTSGSTGAPKGAALSRAALGNLLTWYGDELAVTSAARVAHVSRPSFDLSIPEVFLPLMHGALMVMPPRPPASSLVTAAEHLIAHEVTILQLVPTVLRRLVSLLRAVPTMAARLASLDWIVCNGESLPDQLRQDVAQVLPGATLVNSYGPTEACVAVTWHRCSPVQQPLPDVIGGPAPHVDLFVVTDDGRPAAVGQVGELLIGGPQVAWGYVGDPSATARAFLAAPAGVSAAGSDDRRYRTGDLVRLRADDTLEYVGRRDRQVQLRGVRVELAEVEAAVRSAGGCHEVQVVPVAPAAAGSADELCCFVTPAGVDVVALARRVAARLPDDRLPRRYHALPSLPATPNGKVDAARLGELARHLAGSDVGAAPSPRATAIAQDRPSADPLPALRDAIAHVTGLLPPSPCSFGELDLDSLDYLELQVAVAERGHLLPERTALDPRHTLTEVAGTLVPVERTVDVRGASALAVGRFRGQLGTLLDQACAGGGGVVVLQSSVPDLDGLLVDDALGAILGELDRRIPEVTVALPAYTLSFGHRRRVDLVRDRSESGMAATHVLEALGGRRTRHPAYSFVVVGPRAGEVARTDWSRRSPFGDDSIFAWFTGSRARYVLLGTRALAHVHRCEHLAGVPYQQLRTVAGVLTDRDGTRPVRTEIYARDLRGTPDADLLGVDTAGALARGGPAVTAVRLAACDAAVVDAEDYERQLVPQLRRDPFALLHAENRPGAAELVRRRRDRRDD
ncbi:AMP-binding protein [Pimelobacter simplex]|uniref:AMP-binding protein n=1 Tax=Nocardioides simplex TaxID=2045 RepID=UPI00366F2FC1